MSPDRSDILCLNIAHEASKELCERGITDAKHRDFVTTLKVGVKVEC